MTRPRQSGAPPVAPDRPFDMHADLSAALAAEYAAEYPFYNESTRTRLGAEFARTYIHTVIRAIERVGLRLERVKR